MKNHTLLTRLSLLALLALVVVVFAFSLPDSTVQAKSDGRNTVLQQESTPAPTQVVRTPTKTALPPEYLYINDQTNGIIIASTVLVMIVVFGVLAFMPKKEEK